MARGPFGKSNVDSARQYLASIGELGRLSSPAQITRQANVFWRGEQTGRVVSKGSARGHARTAEHPGRKAPNLPPAPRASEVRVREPVVDRLTRHGTPKHTGSANLNRRPGGLPHQVQVLSNGDRYTQGTSKRDAQFAASLARGMGGNLKPSFIGTDGKTHVIGQKGGIRPEVVREYMKRYRTLPEAMAALIELFYPRGGVAYGGGPVQFYISSR